MQRGGQRTRQRVEVLDEARPEDAEGKNVDEAWVDPSASPARHGGRVRMPYPLPNDAYPHQKRMGKPTMKKVWVPRLAVMAK